MCSQVISKAVIIYHTNKTNENVCKLYYGINTFEFVMKMENSMATQTVEVKDEIRVQMMATRYVCGL